MTLPIHLLGDGIVDLLVFLLAAPHTGLTLDYCYSSASGRADLLCGVFSRATGTEEEVGSPECGNTDTDKGIRRSGGTRS